MKYTKQLHSTARTLVAEFLRRQRGYKTCRAAVIRTRWGDGPPAKSWMVGASPVVQPRILETRLISSRYYSTQLYMYTWHGKGHSHHPTVSIILFEITHAYFKMVKFRQLI